MPDIGMAAFYGEFFRAEGYNPSKTRNIHQAERRGGTIGPTLTDVVHHCNPPRGQEHALTTKCFDKEKPHQAYCCEVVKVAKNGKVKLRLHGERFTIESPGGCSVFSHSYKESDSNHFLREMAAGREYKHLLPEFLPHLMEGYDHDPDFPGIDFDRIIIVTKPIHATEEQIEETEDDYDDPQCYMKWNKKPVEEFRQKREVPLKSKKVKKQQPVKDVKDITGKRKSKASVASSGSVGDMETQSEGLREHGPIFVLGTEGSLKFRPGNGTSIWEADNLDMNLSRLEFPISVQNGEDNDIQNKHLSDVTVDQPASPMNEGNTPNHQSPEYVHSSASKLRKQRGGTTNLRRLAMDNSRIKFQNPNKPRSSAQQSSSSSRTSAPASRLTNGSGSVSTKNSSTVEQNENENTSSDVIASKTVDAVAGSSDKNKGSDWLESTSNTTDAVSKNSPVKDSEPPTSPGPVEDPDTPKIDEAPSVVLRLTYDDYGVPQFDRETDKKNPMNSLAASSAAPQAGNESKATPRKAGRPSKKKGKKSGRRRK